MIAVAVFLGLCAALAQGGPLAALGEGGAAVALPAALAAGWAAVRGPREAIAIAFAAAAVLGALSEARVGLYALALLPAVAAGMLAGIGVPTRRTRAARTALAGCVGAAAYVGLLHLASGGVPGGPQLAWGFAASTLMAAMTCIALFPLRPHDRRLFA